MEGRREGGRKRKEEEEKEEKEEKEERCLMSQLLDQAGLHLGVAPPFL